LRRQQRRAGQRGRTARRDAAAPLAQHDAAERGRRDQTEAELVVAVEHEGCDEADHDPAHGAADRQQQVEARELLHRRAQPRRLAVQRHAQHEQRAEVERHRGLHLGADGMHQPEAGEQQRRAGQRQPQTAPVPAVALEAQDEAREVHRQRQDPQERDRRDVLRDVVRHCQQQP
jgi:hypothetical protein